MHVVAALLALLVITTETAFLDVCSDPNITQWSWSADGKLTFLSSPARCLTAPNHLQNGAYLSIQDCHSNDPKQQWVFNKGNGTIVSAVDPKYCVNIANYGTTRWSEVWLWECDPTDCRSNCVWSWEPPRLVNPATKLCIAGADLTPRTCAPGSAGLKYQFCNTSLSLEQRARELVKLLPTDDKLALIDIVSMSQYFNAALNIKRYDWDSTCIHGLSSNSRIPVTVFPHAIALGATFDVEIIKKVSEITAIEARIIHNMVYRDSGGMQNDAISCDGGPLANTAYDPRWGRIAECYGEDPYHASVIGVAATLALQNRTADGRLQTSQVTRHFIGDHESNYDNLDGGNFNMTMQYLHDQFLPTFEAFQVEGRAEGIMCSIGALNGVPSCIDPYLMNTTLRQTYKTDCFVQTDCCDSITEIATAHHYKGWTIAQATKAAMDAGVQVIYSMGPQPILQAIKDGLTDDAARQSLDDKVARALLTRFRLGEFDADNEFLHPDESLLDSAEHRKAARKAMAASVVLLQNENNVLPLRTLPPRVGVIGPWINRTDKSGGYYGNTGYLHSYNGWASYVSTIVDAVIAEAGVHSATVRSAEGTGDIKPTTPQDFDNAVDIAGWANVTILCVGLGELVEAEGLDRKDLTLPAVQQTLVTAVKEKVAQTRAQTNGRVIMVIVSGGGTAVDKGDADAIVQAWYGGEETGNGLVDVLVGRVVPSARLPLTVYQKNYTTLIGHITDCNMISGSEGRTYRYLRGAPLFPFGFGLSYTTFSYSSPQILAHANNTYFVSARVTNTGETDAHEVAQLYIIPPRVPGLVTPNISLQGFQRVSIAVRDSVTVNFVLLPKQLTTVLADGSRSLTLGTYTYWVGGCQPQTIGSTSNVVKGTFTVTNPRWSE